MTTRTTTITAFFLLLLVFGTARTKSGACSHAFSTSSSSSSPVEIEEQQQQSQQQQQREQHEKQQRRRQQQKNSDVDEPVSLVDFLYSREDLSELLTLLEFSNVLNYTKYFVEGSTVFLPNNDAYAKMSIFEVSQLFQPELFTHTMSLALHFVTATKTSYTTSNDLVDGFQIQMNNMKSDIVRVTRRSTGAGGNGGDDTMIILNSEIAFEDTIRNLETKEARIVEGDIVTADCYVHIVDTVLWPPWYYLTPAKFLERNEAGNLSLMYGLMVTAGLEEEFDRATIRTMLVVHDDIISNLPVATLDYFNDPNNVEDIGDVLRYHMLVTMVDLLNPDMNREDVAVETLLSDHPLTVSRGIDGMFIGSVAVDEVYNALFEEGFVYYIGGLLIPPNINIPGMSTRRS